MDSLWNVFRSPPPLWIRCCLLSRSSHSIFSGDDYLETSFLQNGNSLPSLYRGKRLHISMSGAMQWPKKCICGDKIKLSWQCILGKCVPDVLGGPYHICGNASQRQPDSEMWFLSCTGNGCWRLFLSLQFWWLQDGLGNKDSAEISLHFPPSPAAYPWHLETGNSMSS